jgi:prepilin-type N-terminal cleavage/methylation domain-containing protein
MNRPSGFTLVEVMTAMVIAVIVIGSIYASFLTTANTQSSGMVRSTMEQDAVRVLDAAADEIRNARADSVTVTIVAGFPAIRFVKVLSVKADGTNLESGQITLTCALDPKEIANGKDDNGNKLVDEWIMIRNEVGKDPAVLCRNVKNGGMLAALLTNGSVRLTLTFQGVDLKGNILERTLSTTLTPRN